MDSQHTLSPRKHPNGFTGDTQAQPTRTHSSDRWSRRWTNGQRVVALPSSSVFNPKFDLTLLRSLLEQEGFQIPTKDLEVSLQIALDSSSIRRVIFLNSNIFNLILAPVLYIVLWCAAYSTIHLYLESTITDFWVLCLCVSLVSIAFTSALLLVLHHTNKEINLSTDMRLLQVNERLIRHRLLIGVADWVQHCTGTLQLFCVYWDLVPCVASLTAALEDLAATKEDLQKKIKKRMSGLSLVTEVVPFDPDVISLEPEPPEEARPLLEEREDVYSTASSHREETKLTQTLSLVPDVNLPLQDVARQLLLTYSAAYIKQLVSERLPNGPPPGLAHGRPSHCTTTAQCLCQYVSQKVLQ